MGLIGPSRVRIPPPPFELAKALQTSKKGLRSPRRQAADVTLGQEPDQSNFALCGDSSRSHVDRARRGPGARLTARPDRVQAKDPRRWRSSSWPALGDDPPSLWTIPWEGSESSQRPPCPARGGLGLTTRFPTGGRFVAECDAYASLSLVRSNVLVFVGRGRGRCLLVALR